MNRTMTSGPRAGLDGCPPLPVWATAQRDARTQRRGRYVPESMAHPGKMLPAIAAAAITRYTAPGDLVADPMCGIGTTLAEAAYLGRDAVGVEFESRWARVAAANIDWARRHGAAGDAQVIQGDARQLNSLLPSAAAGTAALILTSPPYGPSIHGQVRAEARSGGGGVTKFDNTYGTDPANLASRRLDDLLAGFGEILTAAEDTAAARRDRRDHHPALAPARRAGRLPRRGPGRRDRRRPDPRRAVRRAARRNARRPPDRPALVLPARQHPQGPRAGQARHLIAHEDVLVFRVLLLPGGPGEQIDPQREQEQPPQERPGRGPRADGQAGQRAALHRPRTWAGRRGPAARAPVTAAWNWRSPPPWTPGGPGCAIPGTSPSWTGPRLLIKAAAIPGTADVTGTGLRAAA